MLTVWDDEDEYVLEEYEIRGKFALEFVQIGDWEKNGKIVPDEEVPRYVQDQAERDALSGLEQGYL